MIHQTIHLQNKMYGSPNTTSVTFLNVKRIPLIFTVSDKFTESMYVLANEPSVALYRLQEHVRRSLPELVQHKVSYE